MPAYTRCCHQKVFYLQTTRRMCNICLFRNTTAVEQECIAATVVSYRNKLSLDSSHVNHMYRMVTSCFHDNTNLTLVNKCLHPDTDAFSENLPVTSQITGYTYWNKPCAMCNDDDDDVIEWTPNVLIKTNIPYFSNYSNKRYKSYPDTYEKLSNLLNPRFSDIIYTPPLSIRLENRICLIEEWVPRPDCRQTLEVESLSTSDWLFESCRQFKSPVQHGLRRASTNIFCYVCHKSLRFVTNKQSCRTVGLPKASPGYLTALFNYKLEPDPPASNANRLIAEGKCNCAEMFDPYLVLREPHCEKKMSSGFSTRSETTLAVQPLKMVSPLGRRAMWRKQRR